MGLQLFCGCYFELLIQPPSIDIKVFKIQGGWSKDKKKTICENISWQSYLKLFCHIGQSRWLFTKCHKMIFLNLLEHNFCRTLVFKRHSLTELFWIAYQKILEKFLQNFYLTISRTFDRKHLRVFFNMCPGVLYLLYCMRGYPIQ